MKGTKLQPQVVFHTIIQYCFFIFFIYVGIEFYQYFLWACGETSVYTSRPPSVEAFLPIGAFASLKALLLRGSFDPVHPAALVILLMSLCVSLLLRKAVCGYFCPIGCMSRSLETLGKKLGVTYYFGKKATFFLHLPKYVLLGLFIYLIWGGMDVNAIEAFVRTPYYQIADSRMLLLFLTPSFSFLLIVLFILLGSLFIPSLWCRCLCPYGALMGIASFFSPVAINRDEKTCIGCKKCYKACPSQIAVYDKKRIASAECIGCTECVGSCPVQDCLTVRAGYTQKSKILPFWVIGVGAIALLLLFFVWGVETGHWSPAIDKEKIRLLHKSISLISHP